ncbi:hypothetical protein NSR01_08255 [Anoxybacillus sp. FSL W8-0703]|uniref:hypothetical protein n=1 Tax=Anoxybacillus sp. FSL W8-0703 TaxID=2954704 RepID=UPI0030F9BF02
MYRYLSRCSAEEKEKHGFEYVKKQLVKYLIRYGTYLKTQLKKDERMAKTAFQKALRYDSGNPVVHYRLGFLAYKEEGRFLPDFRSRLEVGVSSPKMMKNLHHMSIASQSIATEICWRKRHAKQDMDQRFC